MGDPHCPPQSMDHLVVLGGNLTDLGKGLDRHIALKAAIALVRSHCLQQLDQLGTRAVLGYVQAGHLVLRCDPHRPEAVDQAQQQPGDAKGPEPGNHNALELRDKLLGAAQARAQRLKIGEQRDCQGAPDATGQVHRHRANGIVDTQVIQQAVGQVHHHCANQADEERRRRIHHMGTCGNGNHAGNHAVERVDRVHQTPAPPGHEHPAQGASHGRQHRIGNNARHPAVKAQGAATVKAEPAKHQHQRAEHCQRQVGAGHAAPIAVLIETPLARAENQNHRQRHPAANTVDHGGAGKIDKAARRQPTQTVSKHTTPGPMAE